MGRPANPQTKADLLQRCATYILEHGLSTLSLRPLASELGVSPRLLLYHFGSKENLVTEVLDSIFQQQSLLFGLFQADLPFDERLDRLWAQLTSPALKPFLRTLLEVELRAMDDDPTYSLHYSQFATNMLGGWLQLASTHLQDASLPVSRVLLSSLTGLLVIRYSTGDEQGSEEGYQALKTLLIGMGHLK